MALPSHSSTGSTKPSYSPTKCCNSSATRDWQRLGDRDVDDAGMVLLDDRDTRTGGAV